MMISKSGPAKSDTPTAPQIQKQDAKNSDFDSLLNPRVSEKPKQDDSLPGDKTKRQVKSKHDGNPHPTTVIPTQLTRDLPLLSLQGLLANQPDNDSDLSVDATLQNSAKNLDLTDVNQDNAQPDAATQETKAQLLTAELATKELAAKIASGNVAVKSAQQNEVKSDVAKTAQPETSIDKKINTPAEDVLSVSVNTTSESSAPAVQVTNSIDTNKIDATANKISAPVITSDDKNQIAAVKSSDDTDSANNQASDQRNSQANDLTLVAGSGQNALNSARIGSVNGNAATFQAKLESTERNSDQKIDAASGNHNLTANISSTASKDLATPIQSKESVSATQVIDQLTANVKPTTTEIKMVLNPENLGLIQLKISSANGHVAASITASSDAVRQALEHNLPQLHAALAEQGLKVSHVSVDTQTSQFSQFSFMNDGQGSQNQNQPQQKSPSFTFRSDITPARQIDAPVNAAISTSHSLNIIA